MSRDARRVPARDEAWRLRSSSGFTLIELMVVGGIIAIVLAVAAPSFRDAVEMRRLRGAAAQLMTDVQFARAEAASRQEVVGVTFNQTVTAGSLSCYTVYTVGTANPLDVTCDCAAAAGARCAAPLREVRTVQIEAGSAVRMVPVGSNGTSPVRGSFTFDPATGSMTSYYVVSLTSGTPPPGNEVWVRTSLTSPGGNRALRTVINPAGRPKNCVPSGSVVGGAAAC